MKKVLVTGTFDRLHPGHINFLNQARKLGDYLVVIVARDKTVVKIKGKSPRFDEKKRAESIRQAKIANRVLLGKIRDKYKIIEEVKPDIMALGYDQKAFTQNLKKELSKRGLSVAIRRLKPHRPHIYKSSLMR